MAGTPIPATFYSFSKRTNSTKRPESGGAQMTIIIDDDASSLLNPTIRVQYIGSRTDPAGEPYQYNYVHIPIFARYYYVTDWTFNGDGTWSGLCKVDELASWKTQIQASGGYVKRAYSKNNTACKDSAQYDTIYPPISDFVQYTVNFATSALSPDFSDGSFVIGCVTTPRDSQGDPISGVHPTAGSTTYYVVGIDQMRAFVANMTAQTTSDWAALGATQGTQGLIADIAAVYINTQKTGINPMQYLVSCKWFPFTITTVNSTSEHIFLGGWDTGAIGKRISTTWQYVPNGTSGSAILKNSNQIPDIGGTIYPTYDLDRYPHVAPYATYSLFTPWGVFDLDPDFMAVLMREPITNRILQYSIETELISGNGLFTVYGLGQPIMKRNIQLAMDIPITQVTRDSLSQIINVGSMATRFFNDLPSAAMSGIKSMGTDTKAMGGALRDTMNDYRKFMMFQPSAYSTSGSTAAFTNDISKVFLLITRYKSTEHSPDLIGYPWNRNESALTGYSGFVQVTNSTFAASCTETENGDIVTYLEGGIYIE